MAVLLDVSGMIGLLDRIEMGSENPGHCGQRCRSIARHSFRGDAAITRLQDWAVSGQLVHVQSTPLRCMQPRIIVGMRQSRALTAPPRDIFERWGYEARDFNISPNSTDSSP